MKNQELVYEIGIVFNKEGHVPSLSEAITMASKLVGAEPTIVMLSEYFGEQAAIQAAMSLRNQALKGLAN